jgi:hypothetical protein
MVLFLSFHLMPFLPFEVQVTVHTRTATMVIMFPLFAVLGPLITGYTRHCRPHATILLSFPSSPWYSSQLVLLFPQSPFGFLRTPISHRSQSLSAFTSTDPRWPSPAECLSEHQDPYFRSSRARASSPSNDQVYILTLWK